MPKCNAGWGRKASGPCGALGSAKCAPRYAGGVALNGTAVAILKVVRVAWLALLSASLLLAQPNPRELVRESIANGQKAWRESRAYSYLKRQVDTQLDASGAVKSRDTDLYRIIPVDGDSFEEHIQHNGAPVGQDEQRRQQQALFRREHETPAQRAARLDRQRHDRSYYQEIPDAFIFKIVGEQDMATGPAWVVSATPRPGFQPRSRYAHMFPKMRGKLWVDKKDVQWVKADAEAIDDVTFGYFIARLAKGSHILLEQTRLPDGTWVPQHIEAKASARLFFFFNHHFREDISYFDYRKGGAAPASRALR
jgi:hypothetical protein